MEFKDRRFAVMGFKKSGRDAAMLILKNGGRVFVSESRSLAPEEQAFIDENHIPYEIQHSNALYNNDYIIVSPGINPKNTFIQEAMRLNIPVLPEIEAAYTALRCPVIGITGTNGKSTTTYLAYQVLKACGKDAYYGGNINPGVSLSSIACQDPGYSSAVACELSSFQLEMTDAFRPKISVNTIISDDHIDRHGSLEEYINAKNRIFRNQAQSDYAIINADDPNSPAEGINSNLFFVSGEKKVRGCYSDGSRIYIDTDNVKADFDCSSFSLPGKHNQYNLMFALLAVSLLEERIEHIEDIISNLQGLVHRMEYLGNIHGINVYNNSMCTNPVAFRSSLQAVQNRQIVIVGGRNKDFDTDMIVRSIIEFADYAVLIGESASMIREILINAGFMNTETASSLKNAVDIAMNHAEKGDTVNFSPGFASFDMFKDFIDRGEQFKTLIGAYNEQ